MSLRSRCFLWLALAIVCAVPHPAGAQQANAVALERDDTVELILPRAALSDEAVWLRIHAGRLARGSEIVVTTERGDLVGTASAFGASGTQDAAYLLPLPASAIVDGRVRLRLAIDEPGSGRRPVKAGEVLGIELTYVPVSK